jgi:nuclear pore complex protein Nup62
MDEILTRWATDLTKYTKEFRSQADTVAKWDQIIVDHSGKIDKLYVKTRTAEKQTMSVEMQLSAVENGLGELEGWLSKYEGDVEAMMAKEVDGGKEGVDVERERTYKLAERLQERLDDVGRDLGEMVEEVNAANASLSRNGKADEPVSHPKTVAGKNYTDEKQITQIVRILNSHLSQLQAIDQGTAELQKKVAEAQKMAGGIGYLSNGFGTSGRGEGNGNGNVEGFMRSYRGGR